MGDDSDQLSPVEQLAGEFLERKQRGEKPTIAEYCEKHPELADEIREVFEALAMMEELKPDSQDVTGTFGSGIQSEGKKLERVGDYQILREIGRGGMGVVYEAEQESLRRRVALKVLPRRVAGDEMALQRFRREARAAARMHHTNIVPVFDVGEDDDHVFYAMQMIHGQGLDLVIDDLRRLRTDHVVMRKEAPVERASRQKGLEERHSLAASLMSGHFHQENLVAEVRREERADDNRLLSTGDPTPSSEDGCYAETVLQGGSSSTSAVLPGQSQLSTAETNRLAYFRSVAEIGLQTGRALSYAHARGIIHRDIKPSNLLLDSAGVVWVTDFGLAKTSDESMTHTGDILGTIRYMSPERFKGQCDVRADLYSLGLTLYELFVLRPAYASPDRLRLIELVTSTEPPTPRSIDPRIPRDLETVVLKLIDKDPRRRYQSADELCEDLERFIKDEPIKARRVSLTERLGRWSRRNRGLASSLAVVSGLLLVINIAGPLMYLQMARLNNDLNGTIVNLKHTQKKLEESDAIKDLQVEKNKRLADDANKARDAVLQSEEILRLSLAHQMLTAPGQYSRGKRLLDERQPGTNPEDLRGIEFHLLNSLPESSEGRILYSNGATVQTRSGFSPDGRQAVVVDESGSILILDVATGVVVKRLEGHTDRVWVVRWFPDGTRLIASEVQGVIRIWDAESGLEQLSMPGGRNFALSPDGTRVVILTSDGMLNIRDTNTGELRETIKPSSGGYNINVDWSVQNHIAFSGTNGVFLRDMETGELRALTEPQSQNNTRRYWPVVKFRPDGSQLAAGTSGIGDQSVLVWDLQRPGNLTTLPVQGTVIGLDWNHTGTLLATASWQSRTVEIWDPATGERVRRFAGHSEGVSSCSWSPDDRHLLSNSADGTVRLWDVEQHKRVPQFTGHWGAVRGLTWSPNSRYFATAGEDNSIRIWDVDARKQVFVFTAHTSPVLVVDWNPQNNQLVSSDSTGHVLVWNWDGQEASDIREVPDIPTTNYMKYSGNDVTWSPDGTLIAVAATGSYSTDSSFVCTYGFDAGRIVKRHELSKNQVNSLSWVHDAEGNSLIAAAGDEGVEIWKAQTTGQSSIGMWEKIRSYSASDEEYYEVALSPSADHVAFCGWASGMSFENSTSTEPVLGILDIRTGQVKRLRGHDGSPNSICWSGDESRLLTAADDGTAILWNAETGRQLLSFDSPEQLSLSVALFSPDELQIAIAGVMDGIQLLDATPSYTEALSEKLLPGLERQIAEAPAPKDLILRGRIRARQGLWDDARDDFDRAARLSADTVSPPSWFETSWWVAGPYPEQLAEQLPPELSFDPRQPIPAGTEQDKESRWNAAQVGTALDLGRLLGHKEHTSAYALMRVYSTKQQTVGLLLGADDRVRVWLKDKIQYTRAVDRVAIRDDEVFELTLESGWNDLLFQVTNQTGAHGLFARLSNDPRELTLAFDHNHQWQDALGWSDRALADHPDDLSLLYHRGRAALKLQQREVAEESFHRMIEVAASKETAQRLIAALYSEDAVGIESSYAGAEHWAERAEFLQKLIDKERNAGALPATRVRTLRLRGALFVRAGQWKSAAADYAESYQLDPAANSIDWMVPSVLYAFAGDAEGHRRQCRAMLDHFEALDRSAEYDEAGNAPNADRTLKVTLLLANGFESNPVADDVLVTRFLNALEGDALNEGYRKFFLSGRALLALRFPEFGGLQEAQRSLDESKGPEYAGGTLGLLQIAVQALILAKQEAQAPAARRLLTELSSRMTTEWGVKWLDDGMIDGNTVFWEDGRVNSDIIIPEILRREAERLLAAQTDVSPSSGGKTADGGQPEP